MLEAIASNCIWVANLFVVAESSTWSASGNDNTGFSGSVLSTPSPVTDWTPNAELGNSLNGTLPVASNDAYPFGCPFSDKSCFSASFVSASSLTSTIASCTFVDKMSPLGVNPIKDAIMSKNVTNTFDAEGLFAFCIACSCDNVKSVFGIVTNIPFICSTKSFTDASLGDKYSMGWASTRGTSLEVVVSVGFNLRPTNPEGVE